MSLELCRRAMEYADGVLASLTDDDLRQPTSCGDWDAGRVALHLADVADGLLALVETGHLALPDPPRSDNPDPVSVAGASMSRLTTALATTSDAERAHAAGQAGAIEFTAHGWDLGTAQDADHLTPAGLATDVRALAASLLDDDARDPHFATAVDVPVTAPPSDRLAGFLGRVRP